MIFRYERINPCVYCGGQVITIYAMGKTRAKYCVRCRKDISVSFRPKPIGREEKMGLLMAKWTG